MRFTALVALLVSAATLPTLAAHTTGAGETTATSSAVEEGPRPPRVRVVVTDAQSQAFVRVSKFIINVFRGSSSPRGHPRGRALHESIPEYGYGEGYGSYLGAEFRARAAIGVVEHTLLTAAASFDPGHGQNVSECMDEIERKTGLGLSALAHHSAWLWGGGYNGSSTGEVCCVIVVCGVLFPLLIPALPFLSVFVFSHLHTHSTSLPPPLPRKGLREHLRAGLQLRLSH